MHAIVLLADSALTDKNKVHALGLGWSVTSSPTAPAAVVVFLKVPWTQTNIKHTFELRLLNGDGQPVMLGRNPDTNEPAPLLIQGDFEVGRPVGIPAGMALDQAFSVSLGPMPLPPGQMYEWRLEVDGHHDDNWSAKFYVRP